LNTSAGLQPLQRSCYPGAVSPASLAPLGCPSYGHGQLAAARLGSMYGCTARGWSARCAGYLPLLLS